MNTFFELYCHLYAVSIMPFLWMCFMTLKSVSMGKCPKCFQTNQGNFVINCLLFNYTKSILQHLQMSMMVQVPCAVHKFSVNILMLVDFQSCSSNYSTCLVCICSCISLAFPLPSLSRLKTSLLSICSSPTKISFHPRCVESRSMILCQRKAFKYPPRQVGIGSKMSSERYKINLPYQHYQPTALPPHNFTLTFCYCLSGGLSIIPACPKKRGSFQNPPKSPQRKLITLLYLCAIHILPTTRKRSLRTELIIPRLNHMHICQTAQRISTANPGKRDGAESFEAVLAPKT